MSPLICITIRTKVEISVPCLIYCCCVTAGMDQGATPLHWGVLRRNRIERRENRGEGVDTDAPTRPSSKAML